MAKNNLQYARDFDPYNPYITREDLQKVRRQLSKVMNQRMKRLEQAESPITGKSYTFGAYEKMQDYLLMQGKKPMRNGIRRFVENLDPKMSNNELRKEIKVLQGFEEMISSRVGGMKEIERRRIKTFKDKGIDPKVASSKEFYDFLNSKTFENMATVFDSDQLVEEYNKTADRGVPPDDIIKAFNNYLNNAKRMSLKGLRRQLNAVTIKKGKKRAGIKRKKRK